VHGQRRYGYRELAERSWRLANALRSAGLAKGDRVATLLFNSPAMLEAHFGVPAAGGILVAVNNRLSSAEVGYILRHSGARYLLLDTTLAPVTEPLDLGGVTVIRCDDTGVPRDPYEEFLAGASPARPASWLEHEEETISINYTSGTTGRPKGVQYTYRGAYLNALSEVIVAGMDTDSAYLWTLPMFHCNGWCFPWAVTAVAARHVTMRAVDPGLIWELIDGEGGDALQRGPHRPADGPQPSPGAPPGATGDGDGRRRPALPDAARPDERAQLPRRARVRPDRDLRSDHRLPRAGRLARAPGGPAREIPGPPGAGLPLFRPGPRRRRADDRRPTGRDHDGRGRHAREQRHERLLRRRAGHRHGVRRRLVPFRGPRRMASRRQHRAPRPRQGHHHLRRREHLQHRSRAGRSPPTRPYSNARSSGSRTRTGESGQRRSSRSARAPRPPQRRSSRSAGSASRTTSARTQSSSALCRRHRREKPRSSCCASANGRTRTRRSAVCNIPEPSPASTTVSSAS